eukprot:scaffold76363_cov65-Phaeocystis_antarctica.AAC.1
MRIPRPAAEKLGAVRQDPDLDGLLFGLISRATGGCHEHAARADRPQDDRLRKRVKDTAWRTLGVQRATAIRLWRTEVKPAPCAQLSEAGSYTSAV